MNKIFIITFVMFSTHLLMDAVAQSSEQRQFDRKAFDDRRNAFIIKDVGLTSNEAALFIPLYEEFQRKKFEAGQRCREYTRRIGGKRDASEKEYAEMIDECIDTKLKEAQIEKEYYTQFKKILSPEKIYKFNRSEYKFAREFVSGRGFERERSNERNR